MNTYDYDIIVFCGGKCGGTTLSRTFQQNNFKLLHMHSLTCNGLFNHVLNIHIGDYEAIKIIDEISKNKKYILLKVIGIQLRE